MGETRVSVNYMIPRNPNFEQVKTMVASDETRHYLDGFDIPVFEKNLIEPIRLITDRGGKSWRSFGVLACCDVVGGDSRQYIKLMAMPELMHTGSLIVDDIEDKSETRRGGPCAHIVYGEPIAINAGTACYFIGQKLLDNLPLPKALKAEVYDLYFAALRAGHAGQALDIAGSDHLMPEAVKTGNSKRVEESVICIHRLKTAVPASCLAMMGGKIGRGQDDQVKALGVYFEEIGIAFQIIDDVLNLRGMTKKVAGKDQQQSKALKVVGEDIMAGKVTYPIAKAMGLLKNEEDRAEIWNTVKSKPQDPKVVEDCIKKLDSCNAITLSGDEAKEMMEAAWRKLDPTIPDSFQKVFLRAFGWYLVDRHY